MSDTTQGKSRYVGLDFLKAIAAACIVMHHYQLYTATVFPKFNFYALQNSDFNVAYLVILFFMISGFLTEKQEQITECPKTGKILAGEFWHKLLRIYPVAVLACLFFVAVAVLGKVLLGEWVWYEGGIGLWTLFNSFFLTQNMGIWRLDVWANNSPSWYLSTLIFCYAVYYTVYYLSCRWKVNRSWLNLILFLFFCSTKSFDYSFPFVSGEWGDQRGGLISFFLGTLLCEAIPYISRTAKKVLFAVSCVTLVVLLSGRADLVDNQWWIQLFLLYPGIIIMALCITDRPKSKAHQILHFLGKTSYGVYIWHFPLFTFWMLIRRVLQLNVPCTYGTMMLFTVVVELLAIPLYLFVEKPLAKYMKKYEWQNLRPVDPL